MQQDTIAKTMAIIGLDGVGKTTVGLEVSKVLTLQGVQVLHSYMPVEPYATLMKKVRIYGKYASFLGYAITVKLSTRELMRLVESGKFLICDRWFGDTVASHLAQGVNPKFVDRVSGILNVPNPQFYILLTCDLLTRKERMLKGRGSTNHSDESHMAMDATLCRHYREQILRSGGTIIDTTNMELTQVVDCIVRKLGLV